MNEPMIIRCVVCGFEWGPMSQQSPVSECPRCFPPPTRDAETARLNARIAELERERDRLREALLKCQAVLMASLYEPGPGEPPVLRDGVIDKALAMACRALGG